jgi:4-hydroxybenzoyl-CoA thioesterase
LSFNTARSLRFGDCDPQGIAYFPSRPDCGALENFFASPAFPRTMRGASRSSLDTHQSLAWPDDIRAALTSHLEMTDAYHPAT